MRHNREFFGGKVAIVTSACTGIGLGRSKKLLEAAPEVHMSSRTPADLVGVDAGVLVGRNNCSHPELGPRVQRKDGISVTSYIRKQGAITAVINVMLNPLLAWLTHRGRMGSVSLAGSSGVIVDVAVTSVLLSLLVALFSTRTVRRDLRNLRVRITEGPPPAASLLSQLPARAWSLGLLLGLGAACVSMTAFWLLGMLGISGMSFAEFAAFKAVYTGLLAFVVTRWVILRQLTAAPAARRAVTS